MRIFSFLKKATSTTSTTSTTSQWSVHWDDYEGYVLYYAGEFAGDTPEGVVVSAGGTTYGAWRSITEDETRHFLTLNSQRQKIREAIRLAEVTGADSAKAELESYFEEVERQLRLFWEGVVDRYQREANVRLWLEAEEHWRDRQRYFEEEKRHAIAHLPSALEEVRKLGL